MYTPDALDHVLNKNPETLQEFAARCELSGENVAFLNELSLWKSRWPAILAEEGIPGASTTLCESMGPARVLFGEDSVNSTSPFDDVDLTLPSEEISGAHYTGEIPIIFDMTIFNEVQEHIKYLVLTDTWPFDASSVGRFGAE
ncbi:hypothetical protein N7478_011144 [Penicillium angulare]|uniref:uncharacterized protein n=1 Tax=Penicillium angulare TaxID=116970 RepID=UPI002541B7AE|nr:uncharacterized protein N7478_011144 [Penicillium angulare]KAJ5263539.1 hypothetical protein N7478_011144 [Penicillium angulare]